MGDPVGFRVEDPLLHLQNGRGAGQGRQGSPFRKQAMGTVLNERNV